MATTSSEHVPQLKALTFKALVAVVVAGKPVHAFAPQGCPTAVFDRFLSMVAEASARGQFHRAPIGPIGSLLTLADERWGVAIEVALGRALNTFVVHGFEDQKLMQVTTAARQTVSLAPTTF